MNLFAAGPYDISMEQMPSTSDGVKHTPPADEGAYDVPPMPTDKLPVPRELLQGLVDQAARLRAVLATHAFGVRQSEGIQEHLTPTRAGTNPMLATEASCFARDLPALLQSDPNGFAVYYEDRRIGVFREYSAALEAGFDVTRCQRPFLLRKIEAPGQETSSWSAREID